MHHARTLTTAFLTSLALIPPVFADPLHKFNKQDAYWHHGSGWVYPQQVGGLELEGSPAQLDGNDDVTAVYVREQNGTRRTAVVDVYYPSSAAVGAKLASAKAAVQAVVDKGACKTSQSEKRFAIDRQPQIVGVKVTYTPKPSAACSQLGLYFFQTSDWVITIRTTSDATDADAAKALDAFVRALRWDTLGTDPFLHDPAP